MKKLLLLSALLIFACTDDEGNPCIYEPTLTTQAATDVTETSATLNGVISIVSENCDVPNNTEQGFVYSTEIQPTLEDMQVNVNGTNISTTVEGLEPNTTYYVRAFLRNAFGEFYGNEVSFSTTGNAIVLLKTEEGKVNGITTERTERSYDNENRLIQVDYWIDNVLVNKHLYFYTENLMTSTEWYVKDVLQYSNQYFYNNSGQAISLIKTLYPSEISYKDFEYIYNADGTITLLRYDNQGRTGSSNLTILNDQVVNQEDFSADGTFAGSYKWTYDDKNSPYSYKTSKRYNNIIKQVISGYNNSGTITYTYTYNKDNYPLTKSSSNSPNSITEYTYY